MSTKSEPVAALAVVTEADLARHRKAGTCPWCGGHVETRLSALALAAFPLNLIMQFGVLWPATLLFWAIFAGLALAMGKSSPIGLGLPKVRTMLSYSRCRQCRKSIA